MSTTGDGPRGNKPREPSDPAHEGAKPGTLEAVPVWPFLGDFAVPSDAMSAALARNWWAVALRGVFALAFGVIALAMPGVTLLALVLLFAAYMLVDGIFAIIAGIYAARQHERWGWLAFEGIADLVAAAIALTLPLVTILAFTLLMGAWAIVSGVLLAGATFRLKQQHGRWLMALGAAVSVIWGVLLILWPLVGAVVLTWWMGAYALFFGVALLVLAFRLRRLRREMPPGLAQGA